MTYFRRRGVMLNIVLNHRICMYQVSTMVLQQVIHRYSRAYLNNFSYQIQRNTPPTAGCHLPTPRPTTQHTPNSAIPQYHKSERKNKPWFIHVLPYFAVLILSSNITKLSSHSVLLLFNTIPWGPSRYVFVFQKGKKISLTRRRAYMRVCVRVCACVMLL